MWHLNDIRKTGLESELGTGMICHTLQKKARTNITIV
jgi:hypothetical protein